MPHFYHLHSSLSLDRRAEWDDGPDFESVTCSAHDDHRRAGRRIGPLRLILPRPPVPDFLWTFYSELLVTDECLAWLVEHDVTGFEAVPTEARFRGRKHPAPPAIYELIVTGWAGWVDSAAGVRVKTAHPCCGHRVYNAPRPATNLVEQNSWDGSDLFMVWPMPRMPFVSERLAQLLVADERSGLQLIPEAEISWGPEDTLTPGRLSYYMPPARAQELGTPLGIF